MQGDNRFCNNTSDDAIKQLDLTNNNAGYKMSGKIAVPTGGLVVENTADANLSFTFRTLIFILLLTMIILVVIIQLETLEEF